MLKRFFVFTCIAVFLCAGGLGFTNPAYAWGEKPKKKPESQAVSEKQKSHQPAEIQKREVSPQEDFIGIISSHTYGTISAESNIEVVFASDLPEPEALQGAMTFTPDVKGFVTKRGKKTLVFQPEEPFAYGQAYQARVNLTAIAPQAKEKEFLFSFFVSYPEFALTYFGLGMPSGSHDVMSFSGRLSLGVSVAKDKLKDVVRFSGNHGEIVWQQRGEGQYDFIITDIPRADKSRQEKLIWTGAPLGTDKHGAYPITIPAMGTFQGIAYNIAQGTDREITFIFSLDLDPDQDLEGHLFADKTAVKDYSIEANRLIVFLPAGKKFKQVSIGRNLRSFNNVKLEKDIQIALPQRVKTPSVAFFHNVEGGIIPTGSQVQIPVNTKGLNGFTLQLVEVFPQNMLQFLQSNTSFGSSYNLRRVGRPVITKEISLKDQGLDGLDNATFVLDLSKYFQPESGKFYQVRLKFDPSHVLDLACGEEKWWEDEKEDWSSPIERSSWDSYNYNYRDRRNPCTPSFYMVNNNNQKNTINLVGSDIGITAKSGDNNELHVFVTSLTTLKPLSGAFVTLYNLQQQEVGRVVTNDQGMASVQLPHKPFALKVARGGETSWLRLDNGQSLNTSNFDVSGKKSPRGIKGFLYAERGVWRPGDDMHIHFILHDEHKDLPANHPVTFTLKGPRGKQVARVVRTENTGGIYSFPVRTPTGAATGLYIGTVRVGGEKFTKVFPVEAVKPNRLKVEFSFDKDTLAVRDRGKVDGKLFVQWLHGAPGKNLKAEVKVKPSPMRTTFKGYTGFTFDDLVRRETGPVEILFDGKVDETGRAVVPFKLADIRAGGALRLNFALRAFEAGGDFSVGQSSVPYYPYKSFVGLRVPEGDSKRNMLLTDTIHTVDIVTVDAEGKPLSQKDLDVRLYKLNWKWWWDKSGENLSRYASRNSRSAVAKGKVNTINGKGQWQFEIKYPKWGRYLLRVTDPKNGHAASKIIYIDWPGWAGTPKRGSSASVLSFFADKEVYVTGEQAKVTIPSAKNSRILVSLETSSAVLKAWWVDGQEKNTVVTFDITKDMAPTTYVHVTHVQPYGQKSNDLPQRMYGVLPLKVEAPATRLKPVLAMKDVLVPGESFDITVKESTGKPMAYTLAVVNDGLLDLTNFRTPSPWDAFYAKQALGIRTWDIYDSMYKNAHTNKLGILASVGGGQAESAKASEPKKANRFKPVVMTLGPFALKAGETKSHTIKMPMYIGSVRTMLVAADSGAYGKAEKTTPVRKELMLLGTLPRVLSPGDSISLPANIFSSLENGGEAKVTVTTSEHIIVKGSAEKKYIFTEPGDKYVFFDLKVGDKLGIAKIDLKVEMSGFTATHSFEIDVRSPFTAITRAESVLIPAGEKVTLEAKTFGIAESFERRLEASWLPPMNLGKRLDTLIRYPHGCNEQITSQAFGQLYLENLTNLTDDQKMTVEHNINATITRLLERQNADGGFSLWPGGERDFYVANFVGHFLLEAQNKGYAVDAKAMESWLVFQKDAATTGARKRSEEYGLNQAYRLFTLALAGKPELGAMNRLQNNLPDLSYPATRIMLAGAYGLAGRAEVAKDLLKNQSPDFSKHTRPYGSSVRSKAMALMVSVMLDLEQEAYDMAVGISTVMNSKDWLSTQSTSYALLSLAKYQGENATRPDMTFMHTFNDGPPTKVVSRTAYFQTALPAEKGLITIENTMNKPLAVKLLETGTPTSSFEEKAEDSGLQIKMNQRTFVDQTTGKVQSASQPLSAGTDIVIRYAIKNTSTIPYSNLALTQVFPAGFEILNPRMNKAIEKVNASAIYQDYRDDRVSIYFDLNPGESKVFTMVVSAAYAGKYFMPGVRCEAMYDGSVYSRKKGRSVTIIR